MDTKIHLFSHTYNFFFYALSNFNETLLYAASAILQMATKVHNPGHCNISKTEMARNLKFGMVVQFKEPNKSEQKQSESISCLLPLQRKTENFMDSKIRLFHTAISFFFSLNKFIEIW